MSNLADGFLAVLAALANGVEPDPDMWVDEWAETYMVIPKGSEPGPYRNERTPFAREVMRCLSPAHPCKRVVARVASQMLKTQCALNWIGASIHQAPANILVLLPTLPLAKRVSSRISDTIKAVPELRERVAEPRSRDARNTIDTKEFPGGAVIITTAGSASNLAEIPARYIYCDEVDRWDRSVDGEGDPIKISAARASTYESNKKLYYTSSPTFVGVSKIDDLYAQGDQRRYHVPCPHCAEKFVLEWEQMHADEALTRAWIVCPHCGCEIDERNKTAMLAGGEWIAQTTGDGETVSFELSALYMPVGWISWLSLYREYIETEQASQNGDDSPKQVFWNTRLAKSYKAGTGVAHHELQRRATPIPLRTVHWPLYVCTLGVDVQGDRLHAGVWAWGRGMERQLVDRAIFYGDPSLAEDEPGSPWTALTEYRRTPILHASGRPSPILAAFVDSGGHHTHAVYTYARAHRHVHLYAVKGASFAGKAILGKPSDQDVDWRGNRIKGGVKLWLIGTDTAKTEIYSRLRVADAGPGYVHISALFPKEAFEQLTSERLSTKYVKGHARHEWVKAPGARNEDLDCAVYALAAAHYVGIDRWKEGDWHKWEQRVAVRDLFDGPAPGAATEAEPAPVPQPQPQVPAALIAPPINPTRQRPAGRAW